MRPKVASVDATIRFIGDAKRKTGSTLYPWPPAERGPGIKERDQLVGDARGGCLTQGVSEWSGFAAILRPRDHYSVMTRRKNYC
jgi:hypothetical protein